MSRGVRGRASVRSMRARFGWWLAGALAGACFVEIPEPTADDVSTGGAGTGGGGSGGTDSSVGGDAGSGASGGLGGLGGTSGSDSGPNAPVVFLSAAEIQKILAAVQFSPWDQALPGMQDAAKQAPTQGKWVTANGAPSGSTDIHAYGGDEAPDGGESDYAAGIFTGQAARDLAVGYAFTKNPVYGSAAVELLHGWFVSPATRMAPAATDTQGQSFLVSLILPSMFYAASLVWDQQQWNFYDGGNARAELVAWVSAYLSAAESVDPSDTWSLAARAAGAALIGDSARLTATFDAMKNVAATKIGDDGSYAGSADLYGAYLNLRGLVYTAEVAREHGVDLYAYSPDGGAPLLRRALEAHATWYVSGGDPYGGGGIPNAWSAEDALSILEPAHSVWQSAVLLGAIQARGRPLQDYRTLGPATLTHADRFKL